MINIKELDNRKLAAQLIIPRLSAEKYYEDSKYRSDILLLVEEGVGGFCVFRGEVNKTKQMLEELQSRSNIPLIYSADFEFGLPMRLDGGTAFPHALAMSKGSRKDTYDMAAGIAQEAKAIGVHWNLAPVCDVNNNYDNPVINIRSFGDNINTVKEHSLAYISGTQSQNVLACAKHFPGHGNTNIDTHEDLAVIDSDLNELLDFEIIPFRKAIVANVKSVMVAHLAIPKIDSSGTPASLSKIVITDILRNELNFKGLVITDGLDMKAVTNNYSSAEAAVAALEAGNDLLLLPEYPFEALDALEQAFYRNPELKEQAQKSAEKLLKEKQWCGLFKNRLLEEDIKQYYSQNEKLALKSCWNALKIEGDSAVLDISEKTNIAGFAFIQNPDDMGKATLFFRFLSQAIENNCDFGFIDSVISDEQIEKFRADLSDVDLFIFAFFYRSLPGVSRDDFTEKINNVILKLRLGKPAVGVVFTNPYLYENLELDLQITTYSDSLPALASAIMKLSSRQPMDIV